MVLDFVHTNEATNDHIPQYAHNDPFKVVDRPYHLIDI